MNRDEVIARIKAHEAEMRASGMAALYLFGSIARGDAGPESDVDLACDIDPDRSIGLFEFIGMQRNLEAILKSRVDLVEKNALFPAIARHAERDMVRVF